jgi:fibronectin-binding autotransporter adhesin
MSRARAFAVLLAIGVSVTPARAAPFTWTVGPVWNNPASWTPPTVPGSGDTAIFTNNGAFLNVIIAPLPTNTFIDTIQFTASAPSFTFFIQGGVNFIINGTGIVNNSSNSQSFTNFNFLTFGNAATAGNATITNDVNGFLTFLNTSTAGTANITNNGTMMGAGMGFFNSSTAGNAKITNNGFLGFNDTSTAGNATITNNFVINFFEASTAGNAKITNQVGFNIAFNDTRVCTCIIY